MVQPIGLRGNLAENKDDHRHAKGSYGHTEPFAKIVHCNDRADSSSGDVHEVVADEDCAEKSTGRA